MSQQNRVLGRVRRRPALETLMRLYTHNGAHRGAHQTLRALLIITPLSITVPCRSAACAGTALNTRGAFSLISSGTGALLESSPATAQTFWRVFAGNK